MAKISPAKGVQFEPQGIGELSTLITWVLSVTPNYEAAISFTKTFLLKLAKLQKWRRQWISFAKGGLLVKFRMMKMKIVGYAKVLIIWDMCPNLSFRNTIWFKDWLMGYSEENRFIMKGQGRFLSRIFYCNIIVLGNIWSFISGVALGWLILHSVLSAREGLFRTFLLEEGGMVKKNLEGGNTFFHYCGGGNQIFMIQK